MPKYRIIAYELHNITENIIYTWLVRKLFIVDACMSDLYADDEIMNEYQKLMPYLGDYYQVTPGWAEARTAWWNMLQQVGADEDVTTAVTEFCTTANAAASAS